MGGAVRGVVGTAHCKALETSRGIQVRFIRALSHFTNAFPSPHPHSRDALLRHPLAFLADGLAPTLAQAHQEVVERRIPRVGPVVL